MPSKSSPPTLSPARATSMPVQLTFEKPFQKLASEEICRRRHPLGFERAPSARTRSVNATLSRKDAPPALVSSIEVPQSMEVPLQRNPQLHRAFPFFLLSILPKNKSCTSGSWTQSITARRHLRPPRQRESQMTTFNPLPRGITVEQ